MGRRPLSSSAKSAFVHLSSVTTGGPGLLAGRPSPDVAIRSGIRTARPQSVQRINHERKQLKIDMNFLDGFRCGKFVNRGHGKNRFALINRLIGKAAFAPLAWP